MSWQTQLRGRGLFPGGGFVHGKLSKWMGRETKRQLVEVWLPRLLRQRHFADRRGIGCFGIRQRQAACEHAGTHPLEAGR